MIVEDLAAGGIDTLRSFASVDIASNGGIENVTLCGTADLEATANGLSNVFVGNSGDNALDGDSGADTLRGGHGRDVLAGGLASHTFVFRTGDGKDVVTDFNARFFGSDLLDLSGVKGIADFNNLIENHVRQVGDDLVVDANGSDRIRLENTAVRTSPQTCSSSDAPASASNPETRQSGKQSPRPSTPSPSRTTTTTFLHRLGHFRSGRESGRRQGHDHAGE